MKRRMSFGLLTVVAMLSLGLSSAFAEETTKFVPVEFTAEYLANPAKFELGKEIWFEQCTHCHGFKAYPGKAPKLKPARYKPDFVYKRITKGFKKMPGWQDVYDDDERMALVAYILHKDFSP